MGPVRPEKIRLGQPYNLDLVKSLITDMRGTDFFAIDISTKVNWIPVFVIATGM